jgi:D-glycero-alpha-D-manno-heptose 1-phosphate guanylyltransferase
MIKEAIILAGGLGTRLRSAVPELPKCMAPVGGRPFIHYLTDYFRRAGITHFIFALGYKNDYFDAYFQQDFPRDGYSISLEDEPLGTGGAIRRACTKGTEDSVLVLNGDTFYGIRLAELSAFHDTNNADCTLCLKPMANFDRFGVVGLGPDQQVTEFREKQYYPAGLINGGVYALNRRRFLEEDLPEKFSFEKDYLEKGHHRLYGLVQDNYFIDIGIPEDYRRVQQEINQLL